MNTACDEHMVNKVDTANSYLIVSVLFRYRPGSTTDKGNDNK